MSNANAEDVTSLTGPVERAGADFILRIPLAVGGQALIDVTRSIAAVTNNELRVRIPGWLATKLNITDGVLVEVDNRGGKFNIRLHMDDDESSGGLTPHSS